MPNFRLLTATLASTTFLLTSPAMADVAAGLASLEEGDARGAAQEFQDAFDGGEADGAFYLGRMFELGLGTDLDMARATQLYAAAASAGSVLGQNRLGLMYLEGEEVLQDYARAFELICAAADAGDPNAQFNCGLLYSDGRGVERDPEAAAQQWAGASEQNHVAAINYLAEAYMTGEGVDANVAEAAVLYERTASAGNPLGLYSLARIYADEATEPFDTIQAHAYANLASVRGLEEARTLRDELSATLGSEDLADAQRIAREWRAVPLDSEAASE